MAKLYFRYGAMGSGKTIDLLKTSFNYKERGKKALILTSSIDDRYGINLVKSRIGIEEPAISVPNDASILDIFKSNCFDENQSINIDCVLIDEVQFFNECQILELSDIVDIYNIPVIAYGLKNDFKQELFPGSKVLLSICDGTVIIAESNRTTKNLLSSSKELLHKRGANIIGVILNNVLL